MTLTESIINVGAPTPLNGIVTEPGKSSSTCLIVLNSGLMHHVGSCNLSVKLARAAAEAGQIACRFDFSGIGDSPGRSFTGSHEQREVAEITEVMDFLAREYRAERFVLCGLCSGADAALTTAKGDPRVVGIVQMDPICFPTRRFYLQRVIAKLIDPEFYQRQLRRARGLKVWSDELDAAYLEDSEGEQRSDYDRDWLAEAYRTLVARDAAVCVTMSSSQRACYNYRGQFRALFHDVPFGKLLTEHHLPRTRHIIPEPEDQQKIIAIVTAFVLDYQHD